MGGRHAYSLRRRRRSAAAAAAGRPSRPACLCPVHAGDDRLLDGRPADSVRLAEDERRVGPGERPGSAGPPGRAADRASPRSPACSSTRCTRASSSGTGWSTQARTTPGRCPDLRHGVGAAGRPVSAGHAGAAAPPLPEGDAAVRVCGRRLSIPPSKGRYEYLYCLGQKDHSYLTGCRSPTSPPPSWRPRWRSCTSTWSFPGRGSERMGHELDAEIEARRGESAQPTTRGWGTRSRWR